MQRVDNNPLFLFIIALIRLVTAYWTPYRESSNLQVESSNLSGGATFSSTPPRLTPSHDMPSPEYAQILQLLLTRLERVSVDSYWAHRASGVRGSLLRALERLEAGENVSSPQLDAVVDQAFMILERAAHERAQ